MRHSKSSLISVNQIKSNPSFNPTATLFSATNELKEQKMNFIPISKVMKMKDFPHLNLS